MKTSFLVFLSVASTLAGQLLLKKSVMHTGTINPMNVENIISFFGSFLSHPGSYVGGAFSVAGALLWLIAMSKTELSLLFPLGGAFFYLLLLIVSKMIFGEQIGPARWIGVVLIVSGIWLISKK